MGAARTFWIAALLLGACLLIPFLFVDLPPVLDFPNHLARFFVLSHADDPVLSRFYAPDWHIIPNLGFDILGTAVLKLLPVQLGGRLLLATALLAPPLGVLLYHRLALGPTNWWPLAVSLAAFNGVFFLGFLNFQLSLGLSFAFAGLWIRLRAKGFPQAIAMGMAATAILFLCHIFGVLLFALLAGSAEIEWLWQKRRHVTVKDVALPVLALAAALVPALVLYRLSSLAQQDASASDWSDAAHKVWMIFTFVMTPAKPVTLATGLSVFTLLILSLRGARFAPGARLAFVVLAGIFAWAPSQLAGGTFLDLRLALMAGLLLFAGIAPRLSPRLARDGGVLVLALLALRITAVAANWYGHNRDLSDLRAAIAHVPAGATVIAAEGPADAAHNLPGVYRLDMHMPALLVIERKAFWPLLFADPRQQPLMVRPAYLDRSTQEADMPDWPFHQPLTEEELDNAPYLDGWQKSFDYLLLIDAVDPAPKGLSLVYRGPFAQLWRIRP